MKKNVIALSLILIGLTSCTTPEPKALTDQEKESIKQEIRQITDSIAISANNLDTDYFRKVYWNDDQAVLVDKQSVSDYETYMDETEKIYSGMEKIKFTEDTILVRVLDSNTAYALFKGSAKGEMKDGVKMELNDFIASLLYRKVDDQWKVAFTHESYEEEVIMANDSTQVE